MNRRSLDAAFPTLARYLGLALFVTYVVGRFAGFELPDSTLVAASGLVLYKEVARNGGRNGA